jgi:hypothetical protein
MSGLINPTAEERSPMFRIALLSFALVIVIIGIILLLSHGEPRLGPSGPDPYAASVQLSDLKMSAAQNFVGGTVTYLDGKIANAGDKTVGGARVEVTFRNSLGEIAQREEVQVRVLQETGPYTEPVDLALSPISPGHAKNFRLTFEHVSSDWNQAYPELRVTQVVAK